MHPALKTLYANLKHAASTGKPAKIGGGIFSPEECRRAADALQDPQRPDGYVRILAGIRVKYCPCTNTKPAGLRVYIQNFPAKWYSRHACPDDTHSDDVAQYFAMQRLAELSLEWTITGAAYFPETGETVFTLT